MIRNSKSLKVSDAQLRHYWSTHLLQQTTTNTTNTYLYYHYYLYYYYHYYKLLLLLLLLQITTTTYTTFTTTTTTTTNNNYYFYYYFFIGSHHRVRDNRYDVQLCCCVCDEVPVCYLACHPGQFQTHLDLGIRSCYLLCVSSWTRLWRAMDCRQLVTTRRISGKMMNMMIAIVIMVL